MNKLSYYNVNRFLGVRGTHSIKGGSISSKKRTLIILEKINVFQHHYKHFFTTQKILKMENKHPFLISIKFISGYITFFRKIYSMNIRC